MLQYVKTVSCFYYSVLDVRLLIEYRWRRGFPNPSRQAVGLIQLLIQWELGLFPGSEAAGAWF